MGWYSTSWTYRQQITVDHTKLTADLTNFPVFVDLSTLSTGFFANVLSTGADIRVTQSDGSTECPIEIVAISTGGSTGELHFKAPTLSHTADTIFYIYYGNSSATAYTASATFGSQNVWNSNYQAVYHFPNGSSLSANDSTANGNNGTNNNATAGAGKLDAGGAASIDGVSNTKITTAYAATLGDFSASAWFKSLGVGNYDRIIDKNYVAGFVLCRNAGNANTWGGFVEDGGLGSPCFITLADGSWHHIVMTRSGTSVVVTGDGGAASNSVTRTNTAMSADTLNIGWATAGVGYNPFNGQIDEVRIANVAFSTDWIGAEFKNQNSPATFYSVGAQQTNTIVGAAVSYSYGAGAAHLGEGVSAVPTPYAYAAGTANVKAGVSGTGIYNYTANGTVKPQLAAASTIYMYQASGSTYAPQGVATVSLVTIATMTDSAVTIATISGGPVTLAKVS